MQTCEWTCASAGKNIDNSWILPFWVVLYNCTKSFKICVDFMYSVYVLETFSACEMFSYGKSAEAHKCLIEKDPRNVLIMPIVMWLGLKGTKVTRVDSCFNFWSARSGVKKNPLNLHQWITSTLLWKIYRKMTVKATSQDVVKTLKWTQVSAHPNLWSSL